MGFSHGTALPDWIVRMAPSLPVAARSERYRQWLRHISKSDKARPAASLEATLKRQLELLRDEIAAAREAGLSWASIGSIVGLPARTVQSINAE